MNKIFLDLLTALINIDQVLVENSRLCLDFSP